MYQKLSDRHNTILYRIAIRQDEQGRQPTYLRMKDLLESDFYQDLLEQEYLAYDKMGEGDKAIASLMVTLKGMRYCSEHIDEFSELDKQSLAM